MACVVGKQKMIEHGFSRVHTVGFCHAASWNILSHDFMSQWLSVTSHPHTFTREWNPPSSNNTQAHTKTLPETEREEDSKSDKCLLQSANAYSTFVEHEL